LGIDGKDDKQTYMINLIGMQWTFKKYKWNCVLHNLHL